MEQNNPEVNTTKITYPIQDLFIEEWVWWLSISVAYGLFIGALLFR